MKNTFFDADISQHQGRINANQKDVAYIPRNSTQTFNADQSDQPLKLNLQSLELNNPELFQNASAQYYPPEQAIELIMQNADMIPVAITPSHQIIWLDVGDDPLKEWKFRHTIQNLMKQGENRTCFTTDLQVLNLIDPVQYNAQKPEGFVFHMSKCGSTLMSQALARPDSHLVVSEATPLHENFWQHLTNNWQQAVEPTAINLGIIRNLILALGRRRVADHQHYFVRFRSWNIAFAEIIQRAFPDVPCLFMYREPMEVLASILNKPTTGLPRLNDSGAAAFITGKSTADLKNMDPLNYFTSFYEQYIELALTKLKTNTRYLNYRQMTKENLPNILQHSFGYTATEQNLSLMQAQFNTYSKDNSGKTRFTSDVKAKQKLITPQIRKMVDLRLADQYRNLEDSQLNLNNSL